MAKTYHGRKSTTTKEMYERSVLLRSEHRVQKLEKALLVQREIT